MRREYAHVPDDEFAAGRGAILRDLLAKPTLFHTAYAREHWEATARTNVARELAELDPVSRETLSRPRRRVGRRAGADAERERAGCGARGRRARPAANGTPSAPSRSTSRARTTAGSPQSEKSPQTMPRTPSNHPDRSSWVIDRSSR